MTTTLMRFVQREVVSCWRQPWHMLMPLFFFMLLMVLFPMSLGAEQGTLSNIAPAVLWVGIILAHLLALNHLFADDHVSGILDQLILNPCPLSVLVLIKVTVHWLTSLLPLILITPHPFFFLLHPRKHIADDTVDAVSRNTDVIIVGRDCCCIDGESATKRPFTHAALVTTLCADRYFWQCVN